MARATGSRRPSPARGLAARAGLLLLASLGVLLPGRSGAADEPAPPPPRAEPPAVPAPYGGTPEDILPHREAGEPARRFFTEPPAFRGPGADDPEPVVDAARIGVISPHAGADAAAGQRMRNGYVLAVEEANAEGGQRPGVPYALVERDENDVWGAAGNALVDMAHREGIWAVLGCLEDANSHILTRVILKLEMPMMNTAGPDPTLTEHMIPWLVRMRPDDRQTSFRLVDAVFRRDARTRVVMFRANDRYSRMGIREFVDSARRLRHPLLLEVRFDHTEADLTPQVKRVREAKPDAVVMWGRPRAVARALLALRAGGVDAPVYAPDRIVDPEFLQAAGAAAEGVTFTYPFDPTRQDPAWTSFRERYKARFHEDPDAVAAYAYDGARYLISAMRKGGLSRARIQKALYEPATYEGVTGTVRFDVNHNNVSPVILGTVRNGAFHYGP